MTLKYIKRANLNWCLVLFFVFIPELQAEVKLQDAMGRDVVLPAHAQRVISLAPHITEVVYASGAGPLLVGAVSYSDYPEEAAEIPRVGSYDSISYESVLALKPDLVIAWLSGNGAETIGRLEELGLKVYVQEPRTLEDVASSMRDVGVLTGRTAVSEARANDFMKELQRIRAAYSNERPLSVYYQIWDEPLLTLNGEHLISDVVRLCGGRNVFADAVALVSRISVESVIRADPDVIIASGMDEARPEWLDAWRNWESMTAVRSGHLYFVPPDILQRHTPRILEGADMLCRHLANARAANVEGRIDD